MIRRGLTALALSFAGTAAPAEEITLIPPIDCDLGETCHIQQYVDRNPGPGATDFTCSTLSYDGHDGTDFAVRTLADMAAGVPVVAAASGVVAGVRDGMADTGFSDRTAAAIAGRECGNGVRIEHPGGWVTQYCHLRQGSVMVTEGQNVEAGERLGLVGQSGQAQFPHVHLTVRKDGRPVDPFDPDGTLTCASPGDSTLWVDPPAYRPGGLLDTGFSDRIPDYDAIKAGDGNRQDLTPLSPALVIYGYTFGTRKDDVLRLSITGPQGEVIADDVVLEKPQAQAFRAIGKKRRDAPWPVGDYMGAVALIRDGQVISEMTRQMTLR